jgi:hypothetical protein
MVQVGFAYMKTLSDEVHLILIHIKTRQRLEVCPAFETQDEKSGIEVAYPLNSHSKTYYD